MDKASYILHSMQLRTDELMHRTYASPYYDPVKAHEYYMRTRELKGRRSTSGLNEEGRNAASYVRKSLNEERKKLIDAHRESTNKQIKTNNENTTSITRGNTEQVRSQIEQESETTRSAIKQHTEQMQSNIANLKARLKYMSPEDKKANRNSILSQIESLRAANSQKREALREKLKGTSTSLREKNKETNTGLRTTNKETNTKLRETHKKYAEDTKKMYDSKYESELYKIRNDSAFQRVNKRKR